MQKEGRGRGSSDCSSRGTKTRAVRGGRGRSNGQESQSLLPARGLAAGTLPPEGSCPLSATAGPRAGWAGALPALEASVSPAPTSGRTWFSLAGSHTPLQGRLQPMGQAGRLTPLDTELRPRCAPRWLPSLRGQREPRKGRTSSGQYSASWPPGASDIILWPPALTQPRDGRTDRVLQCPLCARGRAGHWTDTTLLISPHPPESTVQGHPGWGLSPCSTHRRPAAEARRMECLPGRGGAARQQPNGQKVPSWSCFLPPWQ